MLGAKIISWCELHNEPIDWSTFEWKGCWGCQYFSGLDSNNNMFMFLRQLTYLE